MTDILEKYNIINIEIFNTKLILPNSNPYPDTTPSLPFKLKHINTKDLEMNIILNLPINYLFFDIGGHIGDTSIILSLFCKKNKRNDIKFIIFEPDKKKCEYIKFVINMNKLNIEVNEYAVGDIIKTVCVDPNQRYYNKGRGSKRYITANNNNDHVFDMINLDSKFVKNKYSNIGIMHIDTEGWDAMVIIGGDAIIKKYKPIILPECLHKNYETSSENIENILNNMNVEYKQVKQFIINNTTFSFKKKTVSPMFISTTSEMYNILKEKCNFIFY
jgi:FkbM family methyltransferase